MIGNRRQIVAMYMRLSLEDSNVDTPVGNAGMEKASPSPNNSIAQENTFIQKFESDSIAKQRSLLHDFIKDHPDFKDYDVTEFVDDGFSGTNFNRPAFRRMLTAVKRKSVYAIIVKDFSRLGRNYIEVGDYIERFFPFMGVRFLSVADGYDSDMGKPSDDRQLEIAMKNIVNAYYSRDLSVKIRSSFQNKYDNYQVFSANVPFGFVKQNSTMVKEPGSAAIVERIFKLAIDGKNTTSIALALNRENTPTPAVYNYEYGIKRGNIKKSSFVKPFWTKAMVRKILVTPEYAGVYVGRKSKRTVVGSKTQVRVPREQQLWISDHHEGMVTEEEYNKAQNILQGGNTSNPMHRRFPLKGKAVCGHCGHAMTYHKRINNSCYFVCGYRKIGKTDANMDIGCAKEHFYEEEINNQVLRGLKSQFDLIKKMDCELSEKKQRDFCKLSKLCKELEAVQSEFKEFQKRKAELYENYSNGRIKLEEFTKKKERLKAGQNGVREKLESLQSDINKIRCSKKSLSKFQMLVKNVDIFKDEKRLTRRMAEVFLEKVIIHDKSRCEIVWSFEDVTEKVKRDIKTMNFM